MPYTTLVDVDTLASLADDPKTTVVDCRFDLHDPAWGERVYAEGHIPGAAYAHLDRDLSGPKTGVNGRHPLPSPETLAATLGTLGIGPGIQVVAYDQAAGMYASRLWWLLRWLGHREVAILDGGLAAWTGAGRGTRSGVETPVPRIFVGVPHHELLVSVADLSSRPSEHERLLVDARAPERYRGDVEPLDPVAGHIPGAINHFFQRNLADGRFLGKEALRAAWGETLGDTPADRVVCYCGSGVTACHNLLAMEHAGLPGARLYAGSWSEWAADPSRPVERG